MHHSTSATGQSLELDERGVVVACPACAQRNRLAYERLGQQGRCHHCQSALSAPSEPIDAVEHAAFTAALSRSALPVLVDFWADWCGPCKMMAPEFANAASSGAGRWLAVKVNTELLQEVAAEHRIQALPTLVVFKNGQEQTRATGARPAPAIRQLVEQVL